MRIFDISVSIREKTPLWPGTPRVRFKAHASFKKGHAVNDTNVSLNLHTGTHLDAPSHFLRDGMSIDKVPLRSLVGPALIVHLPRAKEIGLRELQGLRIPRGTTRILFKTKNSSLWRRRGFSKNYVGVTAEGARFLAARGLELVGVDYLSVASFKETAPVHRILLKKRITLLEGINLEGVRPGRYELICLPLKLQGTEAAPARAILVK